jgi:hypothetical protein
VAAEANVDAVLIASASVASVSEIDECVAILDVYM